MDEGSAPATDRRHKAGFDWDRYHNVVNTLYVRQNKTMKKTCDHLEREYGVRPTPKQFKTEFSGLKNLTSKEWLAIVPAVRKRDSEDKLSEVYFLGKPIGQKRLKLGISRYSSRVNREGGDESTSSGAGLIGKSLEDRIYIATPGPSDPRTPPGLPATDEVAAMPDEAGQPQLAPVDVFSMDASFLDSEDREYADPMLTAFGSPSALFTGTEIVDATEGTSTTQFLSLATQSWSPPGPGTFFSEDELNLGWGPWVQAPSPSISVGEGSVSSRDARGGANWVVNLPWFKFRWYFISTGKMLWGGMVAAAYHRSAANVAGAEFSPAPFNSSGSPLLANSLRISPPPPTPVSGDVVAQIVSLNDGHEILKRLSGVGIQGHSSDVVATLEAHLPAALAKGDGAGTPSTLDDTLSVCSRNPLNSLLLLAAYFTANNLLDNSQLDAFLQWVKTQGVTEHLLRFLRHNCPTAHSVTVKLMRRCCHHRPPDIELLKRLRSQHYGGYDEIAQAVVQIDNAEFLEHVLDDMRAETLQGLSGGRLLRIIARTKHVAAAETLIRAGADVNIQPSSVDPRPCLIEAISADNLEMVECLLDAGANPNTTQWVYDWDVRTTALGEAVLYYKSLEIIRCLVTHGADIEGYVMDLPIVKWVRQQRLDELYECLMGHESPVVGVLSAATVSPKRLEAYLNEKGDQISEKDKELALLRAIEQRKEDVVEVLLSSGVDANASHVDDDDVDLIDDDQTTSPLLQAIRRILPRTLKLLISHGAVLGLVQSKILQELAYQNASFSIRWKCSFAELVKILVDAGLDLEAAAPPALVAALERGDFEVLEYLLDSILPINGYIKHKDGNKDTCLQLAAYYSNDIDVLYYLMERGAEINCPASSEGGYTAIQGACRDANHQFVAWMLGMGADINAPRSSSGATTLEVACESSSWLYNKNEDSSVRVVQLLLDSGAAVVRSDGTSGGLLHGLLQRPGTDSIIRRVMVAGAATDDLRENKTPLQRAAELGRAEVVKLLVERGADIHAKPATKHGRTALQAAASMPSAQSSMELVQLLLEKGANINERPATIGGITALQGAAIRGHINVVRMLIDRGANINHPGAVKEGRTAIEGAAEHGRLDTVQLLLDAGAKGDVRKGRGLAPAIELAEKEGHFAVVELLREHQQMVLTNYQLPLSTGQ